MTEWSNPGDRLRRVTRHEDGFSARFAARRGDLPGDTALQTIPRPGALLFGPDGDLFVPITGSSPQTTGQVRRHDVSTGRSDVFLTSAHLGRPWFLTFRGTDPATLDDTTEADAATSQAVRAGTGMVSQAAAAAEPATPDLAPIAPLKDQALVKVDLLHPHRRRPAS